MDPKKILLKLRRRQEYFPYLLLLFGLLLTSIVSLYLAQSAHKEDADRFAGATYRIADSVDGRLDTYIALLRAGAGLFAGSTFVSKEEFKAFVDRLMLDERYQGVQGIGYSVRLTPDEVPALTTTMGEQGIDAFTITPDTVRSEYHAIIYLEPQDERNRAAIGYDMFSDPVRRAAMEKARDSGLQQASGKVTLVQEIYEDKQAGFLIYVPVYRRGNVPETVAMRREELEGFIYSPFRTGDLLQTVYQKQYRDDIRLSVYDGEINEKNLLYTSHSNTKLVKDHTPKHVSSIPVKIAGRTWILSFASLPKFESASEATLIPYIFLTGIIASILLFIITKFQINSRRKILLLAENLVDSEQALRDSNRRIKSIIESITDGFLAFDRKWNFTYVNKEAAKTLGREPRYLLGRNLWEEFPDFDTTAFGKLYKRAVKSQQPLTLEEYYSPFDSWFAVRAYPTRTGLSIYFQNITDRKRLEKQKDEFLGIASHELKTPVTSIKSYAQALERRFLKKGDHDAAKHLEKMNAQLDKLTTLIKDLLDVTKIQAGKMLFTESTFSYDTLVAEVVEELQRTTEQHTIVIDGETKQQVVGDRERIGQVLSNLIANAIKYSPKANSIVVAIKRDGQKITTCVTDYGIGISKENIKNLFKRFYRVAGSKQETFPGLGLGLYISSEIIKRQGGKIWAKSQLGQGSSFCFQIPIKKGRE